MKLISSKRTWFYKKLFPIIPFLAMFGFVAAIAASQGKPNAPPWEILFIPLAMMVFLYFLFRKLVFDLADEVQDCGDYLLVRRGGQEEQVLLSNIMNVNCTVMVNPPRITLRLRQPGRFGNEIAFCPTRSFADFTRSLGFRNSIADDLVDRVDAARRK